jgi:hypothetical protein
MKNSINDQKGREIIVELAEILPRALEVRLTSPPGSSFDLDEERARRRKWDPVFTGGGIVGLLLTDPAARSPSQTKDVDLVLEVATYIEFVGMEEVLRKIGFTKPEGENDSLVAWQWKGVRVDFLPFRPMELMPSNRWFPSLLDEAEYVEVSSGRYAWRASAPCFVATKFEAFYSRGKGDYQSSKDIEDIVAVIDGRLEILEEIQFCAHDVRGFISQSCRQLLADRRFIDCLPQIVPDDQRETVVENRLRELGASG